MIKKFLYIFNKKEDVWVFGVTSGREYFDNSKYLFEYVSESTNDISVWLSKDDVIIDNIRNQGRNAYHFYSLKGIYYALIAKNIIVSYSYNDVSLFCYLIPWRSKIINLFHGTPLKKLAKSEELNITKIVRNIMYLYLGKKYDLIIGTSDVSVEKLNNFFKLNKSIYRITGYPRNDALFEKEASIYVKQLKTNSTKKIILYMPTFRQDTVDSEDFNLFDSFGFDEKQLNRVLTQNNAIFLIKLHYRDYQKSVKLLKSLNKSKNIFVVNNTDISNDIYPLLSKVDLLVTDYSSVYFDYLLLDKPIIFASFDIDTYESQDRGFYFNYSKITPGPKVCNWNELCKELGINLKDSGKFSEERYKINSYVNFYKDNGSCERTYFAIKSLFLK